MPTLAVLAVGISEQFSESLVGVALDGGPLEVTGVHRFRHVGDCEPRFAEPGSQLVEVIDPKPPTAKEAQAPETHPWTAAQLAAFLDWSRQHSQLHAAWQVLAMTGMRRGELLAMRWRDLDLDAATDSVRRSVSVIRRRPRGRPPSPGAFLAPLLRDARPVCQVAW